MRQKVIWFDAVLIILGFVRCSPTQHIPQAEKGVLDLSYWVWEDNGEVALSGEWNFYWKELISPKPFNNDYPPTTSYIDVPSSWAQNFSNVVFSPSAGYATYQLTVRLPSDSVPLSLRVNTASTAMHVWVNGDSVYEVGRVATTSADAQPGFNPKVISLPVSNELDIVIHVSNYHYRKGGLWSTLQLGPSSTVIRNWIRDYVITAFLVGSFFIMALYHLILYFHRRRDASSLYFSVFCLLIIIRTLSTDLYILADFFPWGGVVRLELLSFYLCIPAFAAFTRTLYPSVLPRWVFVSSYAVTAVCCLLVLLVPLRWSSYTVIPFEVFTIGMGVFALYRVSIANWRQLDGIIIFTLGFFSLFAALINDSLYANNLINTFFAAPFGLFVFLFFQSALLSRRFSRAANDLEHINYELENRSQQIEIKNDALTKLNQEMDVFVYRTSHDLRAPLTSLLGIIALMRNESISTEMLSYLDLQERSIHKLDSFIREILDYSRNSRLAIEPQIIDFRKMIEDTYSLYTHLPQFNRIERRTTVNQIVPFGGDKKRLEVIFNNLLSNALRYYNPYEANPYVQIEVDIDESQAVIRIQDNGLGIAPEHQERIFEMFYRASNNSEGSGLGLFLVKETIEKIGGKVEIHSEVNRGTLFTVHLPNQAVMDEVVAE
jgi:signal transduction histidine kinase